MLIIKYYNWWSLNIIENNKDDIKRKRMQVYHLERLPTINKCMKVFFMKAYMKVLFHLFNAISLL